MINLNGLRRLISLAMCEGETVIVLPLDQAQQVVIECEMHRGAARDLRDAADRVVRIIDGDSFDKLTEEQCLQCRDVIDSYRKARKAVT